MRYKKQWNRRFEKVDCSFFGIEESGNGMTLLFDSVPASALRTLGDELKSCGFCEEVEVASGALTMLEPDRLFFSEDELKAVMSEVLEEIGFDLQFFDRYKKQ